MNNTPPPTTFARDIPGSITFYADCLYWRGGEVIDHEHLPIKSYALREQDYYRDARGKLFMLPPVEVREWGSRVEAACPEGAHASLEYHINEAEHLPAALERRLMRAGRDASLQQAEVPDETAIDL